MFLSNFTVGTGATLTVGPNVNVQVNASDNSSVTITDNGILSFGSNDTVTFTSSSYYATTAQIVVSGGGDLKANGAAFNAGAGYGGLGTSQIVVNSDAALNAGDLVGNAFNLPLYIPAIDVQYLSGTGNNNLQFQAIYIQPDTLTSGQSVALNAIGTQTTANLSYVFSGNFTINQGATLAVGPNVPVVLGPAMTNSGTVTIADNGTLTFAAGDTVTLNANYDDYTTTQIVVGSGGLLTASGTTINSAIADGGGAQIVVNSGGHLKASNSSFALSELNLNIGAILNAGDLVGNAFNLPLYIPAIDVQYLSGTSNNNLQFQAIYIEPDTLTSGQSVALDAIGTQTTTNLSYVFSGTFTINQGATLAVGLQLRPGGARAGAMTNSGTVTIADNGTLDLRRRRAP